MPGRDAELMKPENQITSSMPLSYEDIWGEPAKNNEGQKASDDTCLFKGIKCSAWDNKSGCQAEFCILETD